MTKLMPDAPVPPLAVELVGGGRWSLADQKPQSFTMVIFYRGYHCPVCNRYLNMLEPLLAGYDAAGFEVIAVSMDGAARATKTRDEWGLAGTKIGYGLDEATARAWGLYISSAIKETEAATFCEPGLFWIRPDGRLYLADVSNMPWARPDLEFLLSKAPFAIENGYPARGTAPA